MAMAISSVNAQKPVVETAGSLALNQAETAGSIAMGPAAETAGSVAAAPSSAPSGCGGSFNAVA